MARIGMTIGFMALGALTGGLGAFPAFMGTTLENAAGLSGAVMGGFLGYGVGKTLGNVIAPAHGPNQYGPRMNDLMVSTSTPGASIPIVYGEARYAGQVIWSPGLVETLIQHTESSKDGGVTTTNYNYTADVAVSWGEGPADVEQIWGDSKILWTTGSAPNQNSIQPYDENLTYHVDDIVSFDHKNWIAIATVPGHQAGAIVCPEGLLGKAYWSLYTGPVQSNNLNRYVSPTNYPGNGTQNPDPTIMDSNGDTLTANFNTPAYRGQCYSVWHGLQLKNFGNRLPNFVALVKSQNSNRLDNVISDILLRCNLTTADIDMSGVATDNSGNDVNVRGYVVSRATDGRAAIGQLAQAFLIDVYESDFKLRGKRRNSNAAPVMTIPEADLGLMQDGAKLTETLVQAQELPVEVTVTYIDPAMNWQPNKQIKRRHANTCRTKNKAVLEMPVVMVNQEAAQLAEQYLYLTWLERNPWQLNLWKAKYMVLDPTDVVQFVYEGITKTARVTANHIGQNFVTELQAVGHATAAYVSTAVGGYSDSVILAVVPPSAVTDWFQFDLPYLQDSDVQSNQTGFYLAEGSLTSPYPGGVLLSSLDDVNFTTLGSSSTGVVYGTTVGALADPPVDGFWTWDDTSVLTVMLNSGSLSSTTETDVLENRANMLLVGNEVVHFTDATYNNDGTYDLTHLLRGCRNTEYAAVGHSDGDSVIVLPSGLVRVASQPLSTVGQLRHYKGVTFGVDPSSVASVGFTNTANDLKPASPVHLTGNRDGSNNLTIGWTRRTRYGGTGLVGPVPLHEDSEAYSIYILSGLTVVRTITWSGAYDADGNPQVSYSAAEQVTDGLTPGNPVSVVVYQLSAQVGRGQPGAATV